MSLQNLKERDWLRTQPAFHLLACFSAPLSLFKEPTQPILFGLQILLPSLKLQNMNILKVQSKSTKLLSACSVVKM